MKLKKILALAAVAVFGGVNSVSAADLAAGKYYLRNVESGKYVAWGANWGTRSVLTEHGALLNVTVSNGNYTLFNTSKNSNYALSIRPTDGFVDQSGTWTLEDAGNGQYRVKGSAGYYRYDGSALPAVNGAISDSGILWEFLSKDALTAKMSSATIDNPADATHFIQSPDFLFNDRLYVTDKVWGELSWNGSQPKVNGDTGKDCTLINSTNAEMWNTTAGISQTLKGLPQGTYKLQVMGFYRAGSATDAASSHNAGTENLRAILYAGKEEVKLQSIVTAAGKMGTLGITTSAGYVPNSNIDAAKYFEAGNYQDNVIYFYSDGSDITIGVKKDGVTTGDWTIVDNFDLKYYGDVTVAEVKLADYVSAYNEAKSAALEAVEQEMSVDDKTALDQKIADNTVDLNNTTADELVNATNALKEVVTDANEAYRKYQLTKIGTDITEFANIPASWTGQTGIVGWANHDVNLNGGSERYSGSMYTGDVMTMTINGLNPGTYTVTLYGAASTTGSRDKFEVLTGQNRAYLFANDALKSMKVYDRTEVEAESADKATLTCGVKEDGVLKMGIQNKTLGANWFVIRLESITYDSNELPTTDVDLVVSEAQYSTFIAPFDAELPTGVKAYTVDGTNGNELVMTEQSSIQANTPVVLFSETPTNETLTGVSQAEAATYTVGLLTGVYAPVEITDGYVLQNLANGVKFYKVNAENAITVPANRAYLTDSAASEGKAYFSFGIGDDNTTAVSAVNALIEGKAEIYTIGGVKLEKLQKGINIVNGVPVMVK